MKNIEVYGNFFSTLTADFSDERFTEIFADSIYFKDPFQEVVGIDAILKIFRHMYAKLENPRFLLLDIVGTERHGYLRWSFFYNKTHFDGVSYVMFNEDGKVTSHIDYWDTGANVYEKIPFIGLIIRLIKRKLRA